MTELTPRQLEILRLTADGLTCHAIGRKLFVSENTVRTHRKGAIKRLGAKTAAHAVAIAYQQGIFRTQELGTAKTLVDTLARREIDLHRQLDSARAWAVHLEQEAAEAEEQRRDARRWAQHGYELGQVHCAWTSEIPEPDWLTETWRAREQREREAS